MIPITIPSAFQSDWKSGITLWLDQNFSPKDDRILKPEIRERQPASFFPLSLRFTKRFALVSSAPVT